MAKDTAYTIEESPITGPLFDSFVRQIVRRVSPQPVAPDGRALFQKLSKGAPAHG